MQGRKKQLEVEQMAPTALKTIVISSTDSPTATIIANTAKDLAIKATSYLDSSKLFLFSLSSYFSDTSCISFL